MADPQFGMYSSISKLSDADKAERRQRGINIEYTGPILEGFAKETSLLTEKSLWWSCIFLYIAAFIDFVDGKIARLLNKDSEFGAQYDSLSDLVCFGVAPSLLIYIVYLSSFNNLCIMCLIFYSVCVALRLSRFNTNSD